MSGILIAVPPLLSLERLKREVRHLLYGGKPHTYRVIYEIDESRRIVSVLTIRHGARQKLKRSELP